MKRIAPIFIVLICLGSLMVGQVSAHFVQTHQKIISLAMDTLINDNQQLRNGLNSQYITYLETTIVEDGETKTYLRKLMEGVRDADKIVNGLFGFSKTWDDCFDWDLYKNCSFGNTYDVFNSIEHWPVGDHGYNPATGKGFNSLLNSYQDQYIDEELMIHSEKFFNLMGAIATLYPNDDPIEKLKALLQNSNAVDMAEHFYQKAKEEWNSSNYGKAMYNLGIALHAVQDMTVPHHTRLLGDEKPEQWDDNENFISHREYEDYIWEFILDSGNRNLSDFDGSIIGEYINKSAKKWAIENANQSANPITSLDPSMSGDYVIILATISTVGAIFSFFEDVGDGSSNNDFYILSGTLTHADGSPAHAWISAYDTSGFNNSNSASADGNYELALFPGEYSVDTQFYFLNDNSQRYTSVSSPNQIVSMQSNTTLNLQAPDYTFYHISGMVVDDKNNKTAGVRVQASGNQNNWIGASDHTDAEGAFDLMVTAGTYRLDITPPEGTLLKVEQIENIQINSDFALNINLSSSDNVLSGTVKYNDGTPVASGWIYIRPQGGNYQYYSINNGQFQIALNPGEHQVFAYAYQYSNSTVAYIRTPYSTINVLGNTSVNFTVQYNPFSITGVVTDINNVPKENVRIDAINNDNSYRSTAYSDINGNYRLNLPNGTYRLHIDPPAAVYPDFSIEKLVVSGDGTRNIRLSQDYRLLEDALAVLPPDLDVALDVFEIINLADTLNYDIIVKGTKELLEIVLNWGGSEMKISVYDPDGILHGEYQATNPPIIVEVPNPKPGTWKCKVEAIEIPHDNYPIALAAGISENQEPFAVLGGPYSGSVNESVQFNSSQSYDPDGDIVLYEWDWNNDGVFDESTLSPEAAHIWSVPYDGTISLKVTDDGGLSKVGSTSVTIIDSADCNGDLGGSAFLDNCNECVDGDTGKTACAQDCNGVWGGTATVDNCNECVGGDTGKAACVETPGDFDGDGDIDRVDINVINSHRNQPASACPECDIDGDGIITVLDARKLMRECTLPRCVSP